MPRGVVLGLSRLDQRVLEGAHVRHVGLLTVAGEQQREGVAPDPHFAHRFALGRVDGHEPVVPEVEGEEEAPVGGKGQVGRVGVGMLGSREVDLRDAAAVREAEDVHRAVVAARGVDKPPRGVHGRAQEGGVDDPLVRLAPGWDLARPRRGRRRVAHHGEREGCGAAVHGHEHRAVGGEGKAERMRRGVDLPAGRGEQAPDGQHGLARTVDARVALAGRGLEQERLRRGSGRGRWRKRRRPQGGNEDGRFALHAPIRTWEAPPAQLPGPGVPGCGRSPFGSGSDHADGVRRRRAAVVYEHYMDEAEGCPPGPCPCRLPERWGELPC